MRTWLRIKKIFLKNYLKFENFYFLSESNPKKFRSFSKATERQKMSMKSALMKINLPWIHCGWRDFLGKMYLHRAKKKNFLQINIQTHSTLKKKTFALIKQKECYTIKKINIFLKIFYETSMTLKATSEFLLSICSLTMTLIGEEIIKHRLWISSVSRKKYF